jgi:hypothetical protein
MFFFSQFPTAKEEWLKVAEEFEMRWQIVNCGRALDGEHVRIVPPSGSGALFYNYKQFYSTILMALVNANYEIIYVDLRKNGHMSDAGVIEYTTFYQCLSKGTLNLPENNETCENLNFVFISDEAFALHKHLLKPHSQQDLNYDRPVFNYRLSRG